MKKHLSLGEVSCFAYFIAAVHSPALGSTFTENANLALRNNQIEDNTFSNDVWRSGLLDLGKIITLEPDDVFQFNITFDARLQLSDGSVNGDESIHIVVDGEGGVGGAPDNKADFEFLFTGAQGGPFLVNPVTGTVTQNGLNGNVNHAQDIDLINGGTVTFTDLHLKLTNKNSTNWSFDKVNVGVDSDNISVIPVPAGLSLLASALAALALLKRGRLR